MRIERLGDEAVLVVDGEGPAVTAAGLADVMGEAFAGGAR